MGDEPVCARCAGRVRDGGCASCRAARGSLRPGPPAELYLLLSVAAALLLVVLLAT